MTGAPTKYREEYCDELVRFFDRPCMEVVTYENESGEIIPVLDKSGNPMLKACDLPTKEAFARHVGVHRDTVHEWSRVHPEFSDAIKKAEDIQKEILIQNGLHGRYEKTFAIFVAKNVTDMHDKQNIDHTSTDGTMSPKAVVVAKDVQDILDQL